VPSYDDQELTITDSVDYDAPFLTATPAYCIDRVVITYNGATPSSIGTQGDAITYVEETNSFTFAYDGDVDLAGNPATAAGKNYYISFTADLESYLTESGGFTLTIKNPCLDQTYALLGQVSMSDLYYKLFTTDEGLESRLYTHSESALMLDPNGLCGAIGYETSFDGTALTTTTEPVSYDQSLRQFSIYSTDDSLTGDRTLIVESFFVNYPTNRVQTSFTFEIEGICGSPVSVTATTQ